MLVDWKVSQYGLVEWETVFRKKVSHTMHIYLHVGSKE
jgi:hypothetical protein